MIKSKINEIPVPIFQVLKDRGIKELRSFQIEAIENGILEGKNFVISAPTASGKTLLAELACLKNVLDGKGKALYLVPLKALAQEFYENFKDWYGKTGVKIAISTGDLDSPDYYLSGYDWIIATTEKVDSLLRHGANWIRN
ncbi:MAG: ATP-dependent DNA helicase, partial [bacterium (Candidatus Ratteibacteria) CG_4_9_14_3_um_filter_41_21]